MIEKIRMRNVASFDDKGCELDDLQKINYIYGHNGSGKTTISHFLSQPGESIYRDCEYEVKETEDFHIYVYNDHFKQTYFKQNDIPGVFTVGKTSIEIQNQLERLYQKQSKCKQSYQEKNETLLKMEAQKRKEVEDFKDFAWKKIKLPYENIIHDAFRGHKGSKKRFARELARQSLQVKKNNNEYDLSYFKNKNKQLYELEAKEIETIPFHQEIIELMMEIERYDLWSRAIVGNEDVGIAKLIHFLDNTDWIHQGKQYLGKQDICPFCQQETITKDFKMQLEAYFDQQYQNDLENIERFAHYYEESFSSLEVLLRELLKEDKYFTVTKVDKVEFELVTDKVLSSLKENLNQMKRKVQEPSSKLTLTMHQEVFIEIQSVIEKINEDIFQYNQLVKNIRHERIQLQKDFWTYCVLKEKEKIDSSLSQIQNLNDQMSLMQQDLNYLRKRLAEVEEKIAQVEAQTSSVKASIHRINQRLNAFSFNGFKIVPSPHQKNAYQIQRRDGTLVNNTLSGGEKTLISFLYFMELIQGSHDQTVCSKNKVVVIDDPVSNLDHVSLSIVSAMSIDLIKRVCDQQRKDKIKQVFFLTHNLQFFQDITHPYYTQAIRKDLSFWRLKKDKYSTVVQKDIENVDLM